MSFARRQRLTGGAPVRMSDRAFGAAFAATLAAIGAVSAAANAQTLSAWMFVTSGAFLVAAFLTPELLSPLRAATGFRYYHPSPLRISPHIRHYLVEYAVRMRGAAAHQACGRGLASFAGAVHRKHEGVGQGCS